MMITAVVNNAYDILLQAHEATMNELKMHNPYQSALSVVGKHAHELVPKLTESAESRIGIEFPDSE